MRMKNGRDDALRHIVHPFAPLWSPGSKALILGSLPSAASREQGFYYGHPRNRFWRVLAAVYGCEAPVSTEEKRDFILSHGLALWDVIGQCDIRGSADSSIRAALPNDIRPILEGAEIRAIFTNGARAHELYCRSILPLTGLEAVRLPSTSPANAACAFDPLVEAWSAVKEITG